MLKDISGPLLLLCLVGISNSTYLNPVYWFPSLPLTLGSQESSKQHKSKNTHTQKERRKEGGSEGGEEGRKERRKNRRRKKINKSKDIRFCFTTVYCTTRVRIWWWVLTLPFSFIPCVKFMQEKVTSISGHDAITAVRFTFPSYRWKPGQNIWNDFQGHEQLVGWKRGRAGQWGLWEGK